MSPHRLLKYLAAAALALVVACGPSSRGGEGTGGRGGDAGGGGSSDAAPQCVITAENAPDTCGDSADNDCDGFTDCADPDCSGIGACPVCGMVQHPLGSALVLPDGIGNISCSTDADCAAPQHCFDINLDGSRRECRDSYISALTFSGFGPTQTLDDVSGIQSICANMEHSYLHDLEIDVVSPTGQRVRLVKFLGQIGPEIYLGVPNDSDEGNPQPGTGWDYCWSPTAAKPDMETYNTSTGDHTIPEGTYAAAGPWTDLIGSTLNGDWQISVTDLYPIDNGFIFNWSISFDPSLVQDCSATPPVQ